MPAHRSHASPAGAVNAKAAVPRRPEKAAGARAAATVNPGGRPPKFDEPSRPVTMTLPLATLRNLEQIDPDRARAIVKLTDAAMGMGPGALPLVEVVEMVAGKGLLVVGPSPALKSIPFLYMVEVAPGRFLLALDSGYDFKSLELAIRDVLDDLPPEDTTERTILTMVLGQIGKLRKSGRVKTAEILFVKLEPKGSGAR